MTDELVHDVRYLAVDIVTFNELQSHNDAVMRDLFLAAAAGSDLAPFDLGALDRDPDQMGPRSRMIAEKRQILRAQADRALEAGEVVGDLVVPYTTSEALSALESLALLERADELTRRGDILVPHPPEAVVRLRRWLTAQLRAQVLEGRHPQRYRARDHASR